MEPTQKEKEDAIIALMLLELELNRGTKDELSDIEIVRKSLPDIYAALKGDVQDK